MHGPVKLQVEQDESSDKKLLLANRSREQLQEMVRRKRSLSLNLKRALPISSEAKSPSNNGPENSEEGLSGTELEPREHRKRKVAAALDLVYPELGSVTDTGETFHTAAAESPETGLQFPGLIAEERSSKSEAELEFATSSDEIRAFQRCSYEPKENGILYDSSKDVEVPSPFLR
jgi:kinesin family protein 16B